MRAGTGRAVPDLGPYLKAKTGVFSKEELLRKGQNAKEEERDELGGELRGGRRRK